jgi:hypothetical protein
MAVTLPTLLAILAGVCALFAFVIAAGLRQRRRQMSRSLSLRARDLAPPGAELGDVLYAIRQDFSATELGMIVRNGRDEEIARITFHMARRTGAFTIDLGRDSFEADARPTMKQRIVLHPAGAASTVLCTFDRRMWGTHRFDVAGVGTLECRPESRLRLAPAFRFTQDGRAMGMSRQIGGAINRGVLLALPSTIPLAVRVFVLAIQA